MTTNTTREQVRRRYAEAASRAAAGAYEEARRLEGSSYSCDGSDSSSFGAGLYDDELRDTATPGAIEASLGCGVPTAVADLLPGETVLDLGSGAGADALIAARRVGPTGRVIGLDMTDEMLDLARRNAAEAGVGNVEFREGYIEELPLDSDSVDVIVSNCVINLSADKAAVFAEASRVLRPGGRLAYTDVLVDETIPDEARAGFESSTGCIVGAMTRSEVEHQLAASGFVDVEIGETHRVHEHAGSAIVRARKPSV